MTILRCTSIPPRRSGIFVLKPNDIRDVGAVLNAEILADAGILKPRKPWGDPVVHEEEPSGAEEEAQAAAGDDLWRGVVAQVHPGVHDSEGERPGQERHERAPELVCELEAASDEKRGVH